MNSAPQCIFQPAAVLGEGPVWHPAEQRLYFVDIKQQILWGFREGDQTQPAWPLDEQVSAVFPRAGGGLILLLQDGVYRFDPASLELERLFDPEPDRPKNRLNDGAVAPDGTLYFGSMDDAESEASGAFFCLSPAESSGQFGQSGPGAQAEELRRGFAVTNGPALSPDGAALYFTDSPNRRVYCCNPADGARGFAEARVFLELTENEGYPDGMCCDAEGCLWLCHWAGGCLSRYDSDGRLLSRLELPVSNVTKCAFGGAGLDRLYITTARKGLSAEELAAQPLAGGLFACNPGVRGFVAPLLNL